MRKVKIAPKYGGIEVATAILGLYGPDHEKSRSEYNKILESVAETDNLDMLLHINFGLEVLLKNPKFPHSSTIKVRPYMNKEEIEAQQLRLYAIENMFKAITSNPNVKKLIAYSEENNLRLTDLNVLGGDVVIDLVDQTLKWKKRVEKLYKKRMDKAAKVGADMEAKEAKYAKLLRKADTVAQHFQIGRPWSKRYTDLISRLYNDRTVEEITTPIRGETILSYEE